MCILVSNHITIITGAVFLLSASSFAFFLLLIISTTLYYYYYYYLLCFVGFLFCIIIIVITCMRCSCFFAVFVADRLTGCPSDALIPPRIVHKTRQGFIRTMSASMSSTPQQRLTYEEISQMNQRKDELKGLHQAYLDTHPEISRMLSDFMSSILLDKPDDVFLFASEHFGTYEGENGGHRPLVISGPSGVGKSTLVGMLIKSFPGLLDLCEPHDERSKRR